MGEPDSFNVGSLLGAGSAAVASWLPTASERGVPAGRTLSPLAHELAVLRGAIEEVLRGAPGASPDIGKGLHMELPVRDDMRGLQSEREVAAELRSHPCHRGEGTAGHNHTARRGSNWRNGWGWDSC